MLIRVLFDLFDRKLTCIMVLFDLLNENQSSQSLK